jgi:DNA-binding XRE family transcriptional regulator
MVGRITSHDTARKAPFRVQLLIHASKWITRVYHSLEKSSSGVAIMDSEPKFSSRLRYLREKRGLTQQQLGERAGMHKLTVAKLEQGIREPTWATVQSLAHALGVTCLAFTTGGGAGGPAGVLPKRGRGRPPKLGGGSPAPTAKKRSGRK